ncbi:MAG TPA: hypothetical protein VGK74_14090 [Symbiobacteriaceae bacterium]|jgi:hypothetical protein
MQKYLALTLAGVALVATLTGCNSAGPVTAGHVAQAASGFKETDDASGLKITLLVEPYQIGTNHLVVTLDRKDVAAVEAQVIMAAMGHGQVADLKQAATNQTRWEADDSTINMDGPWLVRVLATLPDGTEKSALFHLVVPKSQ